MNALLQQISDHACRDLADLIESGSEDILKAIHKAESEAQLQETKPKFSLGYKISVDLDKSTFDFDLSWTLKQSLSVSHQIEDPEQPKLPGVESVTIKHGGKSVTMTAESMANALERVKEMSN